MNTDKLNKLIESSRLNKSQLAARCGISRTTLENLLNGADAKISTVEALARALCVKIQDLYDDDVTMYQSAVASGDNSIAAINSKVETANAVLAERVKYLERILDEKERLITVLMDKR